jgi:hypothetical protein
MVEFRGHESWGLSDVSTGVYVIAARTTTGSPPLVGRSRPLSEFVVPVRMRATRFTLPGQTGNVSLDPGLKTGALVSLSKRSSTILSQVIAEPTTNWIGMQTHISDRFCLDQASQYL